MSYLLTLTLFISLRCTTLSSSVSAVFTSSATSSSSSRHQNLDCGIRLIRRQPRYSRMSSSSSSPSNTQEYFYNDRIPKIIAGTPTKDGHFPWQVSLELLHPTLGFLGHWCGGVLIDRYWVLSAAHCVHNDLFNLPLPPLWTVVLGEYDRLIESGYEQRIPVEKIILHRNYHNFRNDLVLMKLSVPADLSSTSNIRKICLPFLYDEKMQSITEQKYYQTSNIYNDDNDNDDDDDLTSQTITTTAPITIAATTTPEYFEKDDNFLRKIRNKNATLPSMKELLATKILERLRKSSLTLKKSSRTFVPRRRNDKLMVGFLDDLYSTSDLTLTSAKNAQQQQTSQYDYQDLPYIDCIATGWGKFNLSGDLTDQLLKTNVPLHNSYRCRAAYGSFVRIHKGHLCAGKLNGKGGTCVGDSGGPLQCRLTKNGPWILAGVTSFGSGCALEGFPDVYTRTSYYMKWILDTINSED